MDIVYNHVTFKQAKDKIINNLKQNKQRQLAREYIESLKAEAKIVYPPGKEPKPAKSPMSLRKAPTRPGKTTKPTGKTTTK